MDANIRRGIMSKGTRNGKMTVDPVFAANVAMVG